MWELFQSEGIRGIAEREMSMGWTSKRNWERNIEEGKRERSNERANGGGKGIKGMREVFRHEGDSRKNGGNNFGRMDKGKQGEEGVENTKVLLHS
jgi:hypothetical protein